MGIIDGAKSWITQKLISGKWAIQPVPVNGATRDCLNVNIANAYELSSGVDYDEINVTYPTATQEVYEYSTTLKKYPGLKKNRI